MGKKALLAYFTKGVPIEDTVYGSDDIFDFQIIAKAGGSYDRVVQRVDGEEVSCQRVNRVYAVDPLKSGHYYGTLYACKGAKRNKIASLPENCLIDNANELTLDQVNRDWYVYMTKKRVGDFLGTTLTKRNTRKVNATKKRLLALLEVSE